RCTYASHSIMIGVSALRPAGRVNEHGKRFAALLIGPLPPVVAIPGRSRILCSGQHLRLTATVFAAGRRGSVLRFEPSIKLPTSHDIIRTSETDRGGTEGGADG